jgi:exoribonuclease R
VPEEFPPEVAEAARRAAATIGERSEVHFITVDPPGSHDLDQALHIERLNAGYRVSYAIADVAALVESGSPLDVEAHSRGVTVYAPENKVPLYPLPVSEGSGSLLPGQWRAAILWTIDLNASGEQIAVDVRRAEVRSGAQHTYADIPTEIAALLAEVGELRAELERKRGGVSLRLPEQEVVADGSDGWTTRYRAPLPSEDQNAQISLLTGMAAAGLMLDAGVGILRTQQSPDERSLQRFRLQAKALGIDWIAGMSYGEFIRSLDPTVPTQAALMQEAAGIGHGAQYVAFDGEQPAEQFHFSIAADYAHATAPLRRLQDRYVSECCLAAVAGAAPPDWVRNGLAELPELMSKSDRRASAVERAVIDLVEALILSGREGGSFDCLVIDDRTVQLRDPAIRATVEGDCPEPGSEVSARLRSVDVEHRSVSFEIV